MLIITNDNCSDIVLGGNYHHSVIMNSNQVWGKMKDVYLTTGVNVNSAIDPSATEFVREFTPPPRLVNVTDISRDGDGSVVTWYDTESTIQYWYTPYAGKVYLNEDCTRMFSGLVGDTDAYHGVNLSYIDASHFDTSNVISMYGMFATCPKLKTLNVSNFNLSNIKNMSIMFAGARLLKSLDLSTWKNVNRVTSITRMFEDLQNITTLDLSSFDTSHTTAMREVFIRCNALKNIIYGENFVNTSLSNLNTDTRTNQTYQMYYNCTANKPNWENGSWNAEGTFLINDA